MYTMSTCMFKSSHIQHYSCGGSAQSQLISTPGGSPKDRLISVLTFPGLTILGYRECMWDEWQRPQSTCHMIVVCVFQIVYVYETPAALVRQAENARLTSHPTTNVCVQTELLTQTVQVRLAPSGHFLHISGIHVVVFKLSS